LNNVNFYTSIQYLIISLFLNLGSTAHAKNDGHQPDLSDYEYTCVYNLTGEIVNEVKSYIRLTPPEKMAYISYEEDTPKIISTDLIVKRLPNCPKGICEGLTLLGFEDKFVFQKNTVVDDKDYFQIKTSHREKYLCYLGTE